MVGKPRTRPGGATQHRGAPGRGGRRRRAGRRRGGLPRDGRRVGPAGEDERVVSTLLTGNIAPNALVKVAAFGLDQWLDHAVGAYGSDAADRNLLVGVALRRLASTRG